MGKTTVYSQDRSRKIEYDGYATNLLLYKAIGTAAHAFRWEQTRTWWGKRTWGWVERPVGMLAVHNTYFGQGGVEVRGIPPDLEGQMKLNASSVEARWWWVGVKSNTPGPTAVLDEPSSVQGLMHASIGDFNDPNAERLEATVKS